MHIPMKMCNKLIFYIIFLNECKCKVRDRKVFVVFFGNLIYLLVFVIFTPVLKNVNIYFRKDLSSFFIFFVFIFSLFSSLVYL